MSLIHLLLIFYYTFWQFMVCGLSGVTGLSVHCCVGQAVRQGPGPVTAPLLSMVGLTVLVLHQNHSPATLNSALVSNYIR